jgi:predicted phage terminase large subunit-like protein
MNAILLERFNERVNFPDLRTEALRHDKGWDPDHTLIEDKASGQSLVQELDAMGLATWRVNPGQVDPIYRAHMVSPILRAGRIWYVPRTWAYDVIGQCAKFPMGEHDDMVTTCIIAWAFMRRMGDIELPDDESSNELKLFKRPSLKGPYG